MQAFKPRTGSVSFSIWLKSHSSGWAGLLWDKGHTAVIKSVDLCLYISLPEGHLLFICHVIQRARQTLYTVRGRVHIYGNFTICVGRLLRVTWEWKGREGKRLGHSRSYRPLYTFNLSSYQRHLCSIFTIMRNNVERDPLWNNYLQHAYVFGFRRKKMLIASFNTQNEWLACAILEK